MSALAPQEVALHSQGLERIELLGHACRELRILYLQNNVIGRIGTPQARCRRCQPSKLTAHRPCREPAPPEGAGVPEPGTEQPDGGAAAHDTALARENTGLSAPPLLLAPQVSNLEGCESLSKLDLTANFIASPRGLLTVARLACNPGLRELFLTGNPCCGDPGYRPFLVASLPQLSRLDGVDISPSERIASHQALAGITARLEAAAAAAGDSPPEDPDAWGPAARLREHREDAAARAAHEAAKREGADRVLLGSPFGGPPARPPRAALEPLPEDGTLPGQTNEGGWQYAWEEDGGTGAVVLTVWVGRFVDEDDISVDVAPGLARVLVKGRLLCVHTPEEVLPAGASCQRVSASGALVISMPRATGAMLTSAGRPGGRDAPPGDEGIRTRRHDEGLRVAAVLKAPVQVATHTPVDTAADGDLPPPLCA